MTDDTETAGLRPAKGRAGRPRSGQPWVSLTLVALLALCLSGCGKKPSADQLVPQAEDETDQFPRTYPSS